MNRLNCAAAQRPLLAAVVSVASGCASITGSEIQNVSLQAQTAAGAAVEGATCTLRNDKGAWTTKPPGYVAVNRSAEDLIVTCEAPPQPPGMLRAISRANSGMFGNIIFGGGIGAMIDHNKGTAYDYPSLLRVVFGTSVVLDKRDESGPAPATAGPMTASGAAAAPAPARSATVSETGTLYRYAWSDRQYGRRTQEFIVRATPAPEGAVSEAITVDGRRTSAAEIPVRETQFFTRALADGQSVVEFAPYVAFDDASAGAARPDGSTYPDAGNGGWTVSVAPRGWEQVSVPAGTFRAYRVDLRGVRSFLPSNTSANSQVAHSFDFAAWYAPDVGRYVRVQHRVWNRAFASIGNDVVELVEFRAKAP